MINQIVVIGQVRNVPCDYEHFAMQLGYIFLLKTMSLSETVQCYCYCIALVLNKIISQTFVVTRLYLDTMGNRLVTFVVMKFIRLFSA